VYEFVYRAETAEAETEPNQTKKPQTTTKLNDFFASVLTMEEVR